MRRILPLLLTVGLMPAASTLEQAGDAVRREPPKPSSQPANQPAPVDGGDTVLGVAEVGVDLLDMLLGGLFAPSDAFSDEPPQWHGEAGLSAGRHSGDLWRWGADGAVGFGSVGLRLRFDGWREDDDGRTVMAHLFAVGPQRVFQSSWRESSVELGLPLLIWDDARGTEYGLGLASRIRGRPVPWLAVFLEGTFGFVHSAGYGRIAGGVGPAWQGVELHLGYEHTSLGGVHLGGPFIRLAYGW